MPTNHREIELGFDAHFFVLSIFFYVPSVICYGLTLTSYLVKLMRPVPRRSTYLCCLLPGMCDKYLTLGYSSTVRYVYTTRTYPPIATHHTVSCMTGWQSTPVPRTSGGWDLDEPAPSYRHTW